MMTHFKTKITSISFAAISAGRASFVLFLAHTEANLASFSSAVPTGHLKPIVAIGVN